MPRLYSRSFGQRSESVASRSKHIAHTAAAVVDALEDRRVQVEELPKQLNRKSGILGSNCFKHGRAQLIEFSDELAASLI